MFAAARRLRQPTTTGDINMQRRNFIHRAVIGAAGAAATLAATGTRADSRRRDRPTFVFVHGAWHGGWCWSEVVRLLAGRGYPAIALDLPGHGITARLPQAYLQQPNFATSQVPPLFVADPAVVGCARINHNAADPAYVAAAKSAFYGDVAAPAFQAVANLLTPDEPIQAFTTPVVVTPQRWGRLPRTFIRCTEDQAIPIVVQDQMIHDADGFMPKNRFDQKTLHTSHSAFVAAPQALTELLINLA
jgi:hypothetical protein